MSKNKKVIAPNEASLLRWIAVLVVGYVLGILFVIPLATGFAVAETLDVNTFMGIPLSPISDLITFAVLYWSLVLALKWIGKTSLKDFVLGVGGSVNKKECLILLGLHILGAAVACLMSFPYIHLRGMEPGTFGVLVVLMLLLTWTQTTWEELVFRGLLLRWACKNEIGFTKKAVIAGVVSSVAFGLAHMANPEISSMTGFELVVGLICYILPGMVFYLADLHFGSLMPGIVLHWINNFLGFTLIASEVSAVPVPTLFVDVSEQTGFVMLVSTLVTYAPVIAYILWDRKKRSKAAPAEA